MVLWLSLWFAFIQAVVPRGLRRRARIRFQTSRVAFDNAVGPAVLVLEYKRIRPLCARSSMRLSKVWRQIRERSATNTKQQSRHVGILPRTSDDGPVCKFERRALTPPIMCLLHLQARPIPVRSAAKNVLYVDLSKQSTVSRMRSYEHSGDLQYGSDLRHRDIEHHIPYEPHFGVLEVARMADGGIKHISPTNMSGL
jgi:hypothetical protein